MSIEVIKSGLQSAIQDGGRTGYMHLGVAAGGVMDTLSMRLANWLVGNALDSPLLEVCLLGPTLRFNHEVTIGVCGAEFEMELHSESGEVKPCKAGQQIHISAGDTLTFGKRLQGARAYLAFAAKLDCKPVMGSYATHFTAKFGGITGRALQAGDNIPLTQYALSKPRHLPIDVMQQYGGNYVLRCVPSVETAQFSTAQQAEFFATTYCLRSDSNRMGLRFEGESMTMGEMPEMISSGLTQGSIQIPPSGLPIVSSVDGQTIGGYPRIANVISADLFALGQLVAGDRGNFTMVSITQAYDIFEKQQKTLQFLN